MILAKKILDTLLHYSALLPIIFAIVPFLIALLIMLSFSAGDFANTAYIINHTGIINVWLQGLVAILTQAIQIILPYAFYSLIWNSKKHRIVYPLIGLVVLFMAALMTPILYFALALLLFVSFRIGDYFVNKDAKKNKPDTTKRMNDKSVTELKAEIKKLEGQIQSSFNLMKLMFILSALCTLAYALTVYPSLIPRSVLHLGDGRMIYGKVLSENGNETLIFEQDSRKLKLVNTSDIKEHELCIKSAPPAISQSPYGLLTNTQLMAVCESSS